jgi:hypothetical protein
METIITNITTPNVPLRTHIAPVGFEVDRIVLPAIKMRAERVILVVNESSQDKAERFYKEVRKSLENARITTEIVKVPFFNLMENIKLYTELIKNNRDQQLSLNISSGSKIQALAGFIAAMSAKSQGIFVITYYVEPDKYTEDPPESPISRGCKRVDDLPIFPLHTPSREIQHAMVLLSRKSYYKLELAIELAKTNLLTKNLIGEDGKPIDEKARISLQNLVDNRILQPMVHDKYATAEKVGRKVKITLTDFGREASNLYLRFD